MGGEAVEHEDVAGLIVGRDPARFEPVEGPVAKLTECWLPGRTARPPSVRGTEPSGTQEVNMS